MAGESQPAASSAKSIRRIWGGTVFQRRRNDSRWLWSGRCRSSGGGSSGESSAVVRAGAVCEAGVIGDSVRAETSVGRLWGVRASKGTRRSGAEAVPRMSPGSRSWYPVKGVSCRPEETNRSEGFESS